MGQSHWGGSIGGVDARQRGRIKGVTAPSRVRAPSERHTSLNLSFLPHEVQVLTGLVKRASLKEKPSPAPGLCEY